MALACAEQFGRVCRQSKCGEIMPRKNPLARRLSAAFAAGPIKSMVVDVVDAKTGNRVVKEWKECPIEVKAQTFQVLPSVGVSAEMSAAFEAASMDPTDPSHWWQLLYNFSWTHFGKRRGVGASRQWDAIRYSKLSKDFEAKKRANPSLSDEDVFRYLSRSPEYGSAKGCPLSTSRLRKALAEARDPKKNELLKLKQNEAFQPVSSGSADAPLAATESRVTTKGSNDQVLPVERDNSIGDIRDQDSAEEN